MGNKADLLEMGKRNQGTRTDILSKNDRKLEPHSTRQAIAETLGWSTGSPFRPEILRRAIFNTPRTPVDRYTHMGMFT